VTSAPANGTALVFLNTVAAAANVFFQQRAIELIPGTFAVDPDAGWTVARAAPRRSWGCRSRSPARATSTT
jgi:hypothetical protein